MVMIVNLEASEFVNERGLIRCASLLTSGHYAGEHEEASFYRRLIFNPEFSGSSSASKSPDDGAVGILITNTISLFCFIFSSTSAKLWMLPLKISDASPSLGACI